MENTYASTGYIERCSVCHVSLYIANKEPWNHLGAVSDPFWIYVSPYIDYAPHARPSGWKPPAAAIGSHHRQAVNAHIRCDPQSQPWRGRWLQGMLPWYWYLKAKWQEPRCWIEVHTSLIHVAVVTCHLVAIFWPINMIKMIRIPANKSRTSLKKTWLIDMFCTCFVIRFFLRPWPYLTHSLLATKKIQ